MRPRSLAEVVGQEPLLGPGGPLGPVASSGAKLRSLILWGPPGSGKTTLARLLARTAGLELRTISAVQAGVREVRATIDEARRLRKSGIRVALFVDEIHRFNKAQQDALLPFVEDGTIVLLGATTENPSFEVISALRSRAPVLAVRAHTEDGLVELLQRALSDSERGLTGGREADPEALSAIARASEGDARRAFNLLEAAASHAPGRIDLASVRAASPTPLPRHDKDGDAHYDVVSALIKSLRGSDPQAAIYWFARMLEAGEDPRYIARRLIIFASEDIGNADSRALPLAVAAAEAFDRIGLPEGRIPLAHAVTYLASAPKSKAAYNALGRAQKAVRDTGGLPVPLHLRNAPTAWMREQGYGVDYRDPHRSPGHFVREQYLPEALADNEFFLPTSEGDEAEIRARLQRLWGTVPDPE